MQLLKRFLPLLITLAVSVLAVVFWDKLLQTLGVGIAPLILVTAIVIWSIWQHQLSIFLHYWRYWIGAIALASALLAILASFKPGNGVFHEASLGGNWGNAIKGSYSSAFVTALIGTLRITGLVIVGLAFIAPRFTYKLAYRIAEKGPPIMWRSGKRFIAWLVKFYSQHPVHRIIYLCLRKKRTPIIPDIGSESPQTANEENSGVKKTKATPDVAPEIADKVKPAPLRSHRSGNWKLPGVEILDQIPKVELSRVEIDRRATLITESLASYGVEAKVVQINTGPTVTQFGVEPGWDRKYKQIKEKDKNGNTKVSLEEVSRTRVKVERIKALENDLALSLAAPSIRIEAPVPGKSMVGIEVPNSAMRIVSLREVVASSVFQKLVSKSKLGLALGKGSAGEMAVENLGKMPHVLIAGATGSGKTVCLDSIIASLLMNNTPDDLQFIMIDPKRVELIAFNKIPHLMTPVITESEKAVEILKWLNLEMDNRYRKLALVGANNIERYNNSDKIVKRMPCLVPVIDELADLMIAKSEEVEPFLCRLAQMGRAVGIHLVVATQRPSVDVVTGLIKANFPTRISFAVVSQIDSRTILDSMGAEKLLGRGDMLYISPEIAKPKRLQGCYASTEEIERLVNFWWEQSKNHPVSDDQLVNFGEEGTANDPILKEAKRLAKEHKQISASFLQRQLHIGLPRAEQLARLIEEEVEKEKTEKMEGKNES